MSNFVLIDQISFNFANNMESKVIYEIYKWNEMILESKYVFYNDPITAKCSDIPWFSFLWIYLANHYKLAIIFYITSLSLKYIWLYVIIIWQPIKMKWI